MRVGSGPSAGESETIDRADVSGAEPPGPSGWLGEARFARGGGKASYDGPSIAIRTVNPRRGTSWAIADRLAFLKNAVGALSSAGTTTYLTSAGFFGARASQGWYAGDGGSWEKLSSDDLSAIDQGLGTLSTSMPGGTFLIVGVDRNSQEQELWFYRGGERERFDRVCRGDVPRPIDLDGFKVLVFICGAIFNSKEGNPLDPRRHLDDIDVVLDAGHFSLNRVRARRVAPDRNRWAFQRKLQEISPHCGAIFSQAHGNEHGVYLRDCDNWIVYQGGDPFPGESKGYEIPA
jgi:hypothetical protein